MSVSAVMLRALAEAVARYGVSVDELASGTDVAPDLFQSSTAFVPSDTFDRLVGRAVTLTGDDAFGLHWAEGSSFATFGLVGALTTAVPTFESAVETLIGVFPLLSDGNELALRTKGESAALHYGFAASSATRGVTPSRYVREEIVTAASMRLLELFAGDVRADCTAHFTYPSPSHVGEYTRFFRGGERFGRSFTGIAFSRKLLRARRLFHDGALEQTLRGIAEVRLRKTAPPAGFADRVRARLSKDPAEKSNMKTLAQRLGVSERSLRRHLAREQVSYPDIRTEVLSARARELLNDPDLSIKEISFAMGFSEPTAFHRAFRRWTGTTVAAFRAPTRSAKATQPPGAARRDGAGVRRIGSARGP
jgi:AraC-like DNA-binding protein